MVYAVKKIIFTYRKDSDYNKVMREVKSFAGLSHMNVVGYNHAWVQTVEQHSEVLTESSSTSDSSSGESDPVEIFSTSTPLYRDSNRCSESDSVLFYASTTQEVDSSFEASTLDEDIHPKLEVKMMLCIQMEFCDCDLRNWLDARNAGKQLPFQKNVADIFKEILSGVAYIHSKSVIHRDLKMYPHRWQEAIKIPILKTGGDPKNLLIYRPIALQNLGMNTVSFISEKEINTFLCTIVAFVKKVPLFTSYCWKAKLERLSSGAFLIFLAIFFYVEKSEREYCPVLRNSEKVNGSSLPLILRNRRHSPSPLQIFFTGPAGCGNFGFDTNFGGLDVILVGDLRQLPPVRATPTYKQIKQRIAGPTLGRGLKFYELNEVMRQTNQMFSSLLTKIGNGLLLDDEQQLIESRFYSKEDAD
ncbi:eukaryotic translation initiation factor 2-alpha kinase 1 [Trichonephila clavipes]|nr:eukaryotic translation initiation factor 2-alpha kinase 1 [Trichonephila clavipes]